MLMQVVAMHTSYTERSVTFNLFRVREEKTRAARACKRTTSGNIGVMVEQVQKDKHENDNKRERESQRVRK